MPCINEIGLQRARYQPKSPPDGVSESILELVYSDDKKLLPVAIWDPDKPEERATPYCHLARPLRLTLQENDVLYLPAMYANDRVLTIGNI